MMEDQNQNIAEMRVVQTLLSHGMEFEVEKRGIERLFSQHKKRKFLIRQPCLGTLYLLTGKYLETGFDVQKLSENPLGESKVLSRKNAKRMAEIVAIAVLNSKWKINCFSKLLTHYFYWRLTPQMALELALIINTMNNTADFTNSIRLISGIKMTTPKASLIEAE